MYCKYEYSYVNIILGLYSIANSVNNDETNSENSWMKQIPETNSVNNNVTEVLSNAFWFCL